MADEDPQTFVSELLREVVLGLACEGGRVFVHSSTVEKLDRSVIELKCTWSPRLSEIFDDESIRIGELKRKPTNWENDDGEVVGHEGEELIGWSLRDIPVMLTIYQLTADWISESATKNDGTPVLGKLNYYEADTPGVDTLRYERPALNAWVGLGPNNFDMLRNRLVSTEKPDFDLGITVQFPRSSIQSSWTGRDVVWDGKGSLPVTDATLVWMRGDWDSESGLEYRSIVEREPVSKEPPREHVELLSSNKRLETAVTKLATPLWIAVGAAIVAAYFAR